MTGTPEFQAERIDLALPLATAEAEIATLGKLASWLVPTQAVWSD